MHLRKFYPALAIIFVAFVSNSCFKDVPNKTIVYQNNFEDSLLNRLGVYNYLGPINASKIFSYNGSRVFGRFNNNLVSLQLETLPDHNAVHIQFDLYIHDNWEGNHRDPVTNIADIWQLQIDGNPTFIYTFSNTKNVKQSFPDYYDASAAGYQPHSDAWALLPGVCAVPDKPEGTSLYKIDYITSHTSGKFRLDLNDALQPFDQPCNKSWSIDNIVITAVKYY